MIVGVLALQGAFAAHHDRLAALDVAVREGRTAAHLDGLDGLVIPGGESTPMSPLLRTNDLFDPIASVIDGGLPIFGTCAGMILCATEVLDARPDQRSFGAIDISVRRNGYGRQLASFEADLAVAGLDTPFHAVFIRAPIVERVGADVEILARHGEVPVLVRHGSCTVTSFHPELTPDGRLHEMFVESI